MAITRTYEAYIEIECCRDGVQTYVPDPIKVSGSKTKNLFIESLLIWKDKVKEKLKEIYEPWAIEECEGVGSRRLCRFYIDIKVNEHGLQSCPQAVLDTIKQLELRMMKASGKTKENLQKAINRIKIQYNC